MLAETLTETPTLTDVPDATGEVTPELTVTVTPGFATPSLTPSATMTQAATQTATTAPTATVIPPEGTFQLVYYDDFTSDYYLTAFQGYVWDVAIHDADDSLRLDVDNEQTQVTAATYFDTAIQIRVTIPTGMLSLGLRQSEAGHYRLSLASSGTLTLFRGNSVLQATTISPLGNAWHTVRFSTSEGVLRAEVDGVTLITVADDAPLPPGHVWFSVSDIASNPIFLSEIYLWSTAQESMAAAFFSQPSDTFASVLSQTTVEDAIHIFDGNFISWGDTRQFVVEATTPCESSHFAWSHLADRVAIRCLDGGEFIRFVEPDSTYTEVALPQALPAFPGAWSSDSRWFLARTGDNSTTDVGGIFAVDTFTNNVHRLCNDPSDGTFGHPIFGLQDRVYVYQALNSGVPGIYNFSLTDALAGNCNLQLVRSGQYRLHDISVTGLMLLTDSVLTGASPNLTVWDPLTPQSNLQIVSTGNPHSAAFSPDGGEIGYTCPQAVWGYPFHNGRLCGDRIANGVGERDWEIAVNANIAPFDWTLIDGLMSQENENATATSQAQATQTSESIYSTQVAIATQTAQGTQTAVAATQQAQASPTPSPTPIPPCLINSGNPIGVGLEFQSAGGLLMHEGVSVFAPFVPGGSSILSTGHAVSRHVGRNPTDLYNDVLLGIKRTSSSYWDLQGVPVYSNQVTAETMDEAAAAIILWSRTAVQGQAFKYAKIIPSLLLQSNTITVQTPQGQTTHTFVNTTGYGFTWDKTLGVPTFINPQGSYLYLRCNHTGNPTLLPYTIITSYPQ